MEDAGFALVDGTVVSPDGSGAISITPKKPRAKKVTTPASKERKVKATTEEDGADQSEGSQELELQDIKK